jgi:hypothetical protein
MRGPGQVAAFEYSKTEKAEIEVAIQVLRKGPLPVVCLELLQRAACDYLFETTTPQRVARQLKKRWKKIAASSEKFQREAVACINESLDEMARENHLTGEQKLRQVQIEWLQTPLKLLPNIARAMAQYFDEQDDKLLPRVRYQSRVLDVWSQLGGKLQISRHPKTQKVQGPLSRYFFAVVRPVMRDSTPSPGSLPDIVERQKLAIGKTKSDEQPRRFVRLLIEKLRG